VANAGRATIGFVRIKTVVLLSSVLPRGRADLGKSSSYVRQVED
jgi:hypothetical protein